MLYIIMGPVGSGKSTQAELLAQELGAVHINTGDLLYYASKADNQAAQKIKSKMEKGEIVEDELVTQTVKEHIEEYKDKNIVIEGFPRTTSQAKESGVNPDKVFYINISDEEAKNRLQKRGRPDDTPEVIKKRLEIYHKDTEPILEYYRNLGILEEIDGEKEVGEIAEDLARRISNV